MHQAGYKVIGIAEVGGGLYNKNGIDLKALGEYRQKNGTVHGFPGAEKVETADLLTTDCEILIPAATENVITSRNVEPREVPHPGRGRERSDHLRRRRHPQPTKASS